MIHYVYIQQCLKVLCIANWNSKFYIKSGHTMYILNVAFRYVSLALYQCWRDHHIWCGGVFFPMLPIFKQAQSSAHVWHAHRRIFSWTSRVVHPLSMTMAKWLRQRDHDPPGSSVWIPVLPYEGSHTHTHTHTRVQAHAHTHIYVFVCVVLRKALEKKVSLALGLLHRQVKEPVQSGTSSSKPGLPAFQWRSRHRGSITYIQHYMHQIDEVSSS